MDMTFAHDVFDLLHARDLSWRLDRGMKFFRRDTGINPHEIAALFQSMLDPRECVSFRDYLQCIEPMMRRHLLTIPVPIVARFDPTDLVCINTQIEKVGNGFEACAASSDDAVFFMHVRRDAPIGG